MTRTADIDEASIGDRTADPADLVLELGLAKAQALLPTLRAEFERGVLNTTLLLTGDQGEVPATAEKQQLKHNLRTQNARGRKRNCHSLRVR